MAQTDQGDCSIRLFDRYIREYWVKFLALSVSKNLRGFQNPWKLPSLYTPAYGTLFLLNVSHAQYYYYYNNYGNMSIIYFWLSNGPYCAQTLPVA